MGTHQTDPWALPAPYTNVPMKDAKEIRKLIHSWISPKLLIEGEGVSNPTLPTLPLGNVGCHTVNTSGGSPTRTHCVVSAWELPQ
jgi:hypothetical protein